MALKNPMGELFLDLNFIKKVKPGLYLLKAKYIVILKSTRLNIGYPCLVEFVNLHDFRYEGGAPINSGFQIPLVSDKREYGLGYQARTT